MPKTNSWSGNPDAEFDQDFADGYIGKYVLIGVTRLSEEGERLYQEQLHGYIEHISPEGIDIVLVGVNEGQSWRMPCMLEEFEPATAGLYELKETGETIENPDFTLVLTVRSGKKN